MVHFLAFVMVLALAAPLTAAAQEARYRACLDLTRKKADDAFETALQWQSQGGGDPAAHCAALALVELRQYGEAAQRLERLAESLQRQESRLLPAVLAQAANAWLLAGDPARAELRLEEALRLRPDEATLLVDRARARAAKGDTAAAVADLDAALRQAPENAAAWAYRAAARRAAGDAAGALEDAETALAIDPDQTVALLERGHLRRAAGDLRRARADFIRVRLLEEHTPLADAAGRAIEEMDVRVR